MLYPTINPIYRVPDLDGILHTLEKNKELIATRSLNVPRDTSVFELAAFAFNIAFLSMRAAGSE